MKSVSIKKKGVLLFAIRSDEFLKSYARTASRKLRRLYFTHLTSKLSVITDLQSIPSLSLGSQWRVGWGRFWDEINLLLLLLPQPEIQFLLREILRWSHHGNIAVFASYTYFILGAILCSGISTVDGVKASHLNVGVLEYVCPIRRDEVGTLHQGPSSGSQTIWSMAVAVFVIVYSVIQGYYYY
jgi:hypothetical protein